MLFYDIDTPITIARLRARGKAEYLDAELIPQYAAYLSFTGGPMLREIEERFGSPLGGAVLLFGGPEIVQAGGRCRRSLRAT